MFISGKTTKYIILLVIIAAILYFVGSLFSIGTLEAIEGNWAGYLLLTVTYISLIIITQIFKEKLKNQDITKYLLLGIGLHNILCLMYFLTTLSEYFILVMLIPLVIYCYAWYNFEEFTSKLTIFKYYLPTSTPGHPFAYDKENKAYVYRNWNGYEVLKYLEIKARDDSVELLTVIYKSQIELSFEIHYFKNSVRFYCGIIGSGRSYEKALKNCKEKYFDLYKFLRIFGFNPVKIDDDFTMEKILEAPYLAWDPANISKIHKNKNPDDEQIIVEPGMKKIKFSLYQLTLIKSLDTTKKFNSRITIEKQDEKQIRTEILETDSNISKMSNFLDRIMQQKLGNDNFLIVIRFHPYNESELQKEQRKIKSNMQSIVSKFNDDLLQDDSKLKILTLGNALGGNGSNSDGNMLKLLYPDESKSLKEFNSELNKYNIGEHIGYWKTCTYFVGKKYLAKIFATYLGAELHSLNYLKMPNIFRRKINGLMENMDSKTAINLLPFSVSL